MASITGMPGSGSKCNSFPHFPNLPYKVYLKILELSFLWSLGEYLMLLEFQIHFADFIPAICMNFTYELGEDFLMG